MNLAGDHQPGMRGKSSRLKDVTEVGSGMEERRKSGPSTRATTASNAVAALPRDERFMKRVLRNEHLKLETGNSKLFLLLRRRLREHTSELQSPCNLVCRLLL